MGLCLSKSECQYVLRTDTRITQFAPSQFAISGRAFLSKNKPVAIPRETSIGFRIATAPRIAIELSSCELQRQRCPGVLNIPAQMEIYQGGTRRYCTLDKEGARAAVVASSLATNNPTGSFERQLTASPERYEVGGNRFLVRCKLLARLSSQSKGASSNNVLYLLRSATGSMVSLHFKGLWRYR